MASTKGQEVSKAELLEILGTTHVTVDAWIAEGMPVEKQGGSGNEYRFNTKEVIRWLCTKAAETGRVPGAGNRKPIREPGIVGGVESQAEAERRLMIAKANTAETEYLKNRGALVPVAEVASAVEQDYANVRAKALALPSKIAARVKAARSIQDVRALLDEAMREVLEALAFRPPAGTDDDEAAGSA